MRFVRSSRGFAWVAALSALGASVVGGSACTPSGGASSRDRVGGKVDEPGLAGFHLRDDDARFVLADRLPFQRDREVRIPAEEGVLFPFAHALGRWSTHAFTAFPRSTYHFRAEVDDAMRARSKLFVFGPRHADGAWPMRLERTPGADGVMEAVLEDAPYGEYAVVVGPEPERGFLPRYPARTVRVERDGRTMEAAVVAKGEGFALELEGESLSIVTTPAEAADAEALVVRTPSGEERLQIEQWLFESYVDVEGGLGRARYDGDGVVLLDRGDGEERYHVLSLLGRAGEVLTLDAGELPAFADLVPAEHDGRAISVTRDEDCYRLSTVETKSFCSVAEDEVGAPLSDEVLDAIRLDVRVLAVDPRESSGYALEARCDGECAPRVVRTEHPIFLAREFEDVEAPTLAELEDAGLSSWVAAGDVLPHVPAYVRSEQLRRSLTAFVGRLEADGEDDVRVNVIARGLAGLDVGDLVGLEKYNGPSCGDAKLVCRSPEGVGPCCTDAEGNAAACCLDGVPWRERIVSITTLDTPFCGSAFATWALEQLDEMERSGGTVPPAIARAAHDIFGLNAGVDLDALRTTLAELSRDGMPSGHRAYCEERAAGEVATYAGIDPGRAYRFSCVTGEESCEPISVPSVDRPRASDAGRPLLPAPSRASTLFRWGSVGCATGACGARLDPALALPAALAAGGVTAGIADVASVAEGPGILMGFVPLDGDPLSLRRHLLSWVEWLAESGY